MNDARQELIDRLNKRLNNYFGVGGLHNPEAMEHDKVRDLLRDCRTAFSADASATPVARQKDKLKRLYEAADVLLIELDAAPHDSRDASDCDICRATDKFRQTFYTMADITVSTLSAPAAVARQEIPREPTEAMLDAADRLSGDVQFYNAL